MDMVRTGAPELWSFVEDAIKDSVAKGYLQE